MEVANPFTEEVFWRYLCHLSDSQAAPTKASDAMSSMRFAQHVLWFDCLDLATRSRRLSGLSDIMLSEKRVLKQATVLQVAQVRKLHTLLSDARTHEIDMVMSAYVLLALYGRCRRSDLAFIESVSHDFSKLGGFIEVSTRCHKSGRSARQKSQLLPILVPAVGVTGHMWLGEAVDAFVQVGLPALCCPRLRKARALSA